MPSESVLLIGLSPQESAVVKQLLSRFEIETRSEDISKTEELQDFLSQTNICLVILRMDEHHGRPDQQIRRIKRLLPHPVPLLLLIPPDLTSKIRSYLHAGADDYWVEPLDEIVFPPRLFVLLEWGQSIVRGESQPLSKKGLPKLNGSSLWKRILEVIRRRLSFSFGKDAPEQTRLLIADKWEKIRRLGFGSFGEVWLIREQEKGTSAVAKIPHSEKMNTKFLREAAILKRLTDHPHAVRLMEVVKEAGKVILIQEYAEGSTLQDLLDQGMKADRKERAFLQLLEMVAHAHRHHIMHRDIKPENIIITPSGGLKLLDFGTAKDLSYRSMSSTMIGSRPFMAPEQIMGKSCIASDVWALGVILYTLATECLPFYDDNEKTLMDLILEINPEPPCSLEPDLPKELESVILKCLEKDLDRRYADATELREDLLKAFQDFGSGNVLPGE